MTAANPNAAVQTNLGLGGGNNGNGGGGGITITLGIIVVVDVVAGGVVFINGGREISQNGPAVESTHDSSVALVEQLGSHQGQNVPMKASTSGRHWQTWRWPRKMAGSVVKG